MLGITDFWTYVLGTVAIILLPGPNSIFVLSVAAQRGVRAGYRAAFGVFVGDTVLMVLAAAGVASLLRAYPPIFMVIKYAGGAYLAWVGLGIIRSAWRKRRERGGVVDRRPTGAAGADASGAIAVHEVAAGDDLAPSAVPSAGQSPPEGTPVGMRRPFRRALIVSLLNPKAILFIVSFLIQFVEPGYAHPALSFLVLGAVLQLFSALYLSGLIFGGQFLAGQFRRRRRLSAAASTGIGVLFVGFGIKLATASAG
ncbi:leucine efflux protein LeuE [Couchioplanes caeruleus]|uniref:Leucine efflux protein n=1 Tax=Couchioplanes caeruleus TaxID=56438 RepID=A0A3N1GQX1_9ACTN|nr:leucine efflux protein LeuE [Couchioplanes caeruleus]ROP32622.1 leucine efflux protein [Couchioplanes caeruleus]